jgi:hypothetical protein
MFALLFCLDYVYAKYTMAAAKRHAGRASFWAAWCYGFTGLATLQYVDDHWLLIPAIAGCVCGTYVAIKRQALLVESADTADSKSAATSM